MAIGAIRQGTFTRQHSDGVTTVAALIGGTTYSHLLIKANGGPFLIGDNTLDQSGSSTAQGYKLSPGESIQLQNDGATAGLLTGGNINIRAGGDRQISISIMAIDNA